MGERECVVHIRLFGVYCFYRSEKNIVQLRGDFGNGVGGMSHETIRDQCMYQRHGAPYQ